MPKGQIEFRRIGDSTLSIDPRQQGRDAVPTGRQGVCCVSMS